MHERLITLAREDWGQDSDMVKACENIVSEISKKKAEALRHLTFASIHKLSGSILEAKDIIRLTQYLSGERICLFKTGFEYITDTDSFVLDAENSYHAVHKNIIAHPVTGELIHDVKHDVFMFFSVNEEALID